MTKDLNLAAKIICDDSDLDSSDNEKHHQNIYAHELKENFNMEDSPLNIRISDNEYQSDGPYTIDRIEKSLPSLSSEELKFESFTISKNNNERRRVLSFANSSSSSSSNSSGSFNSSSSSNSNSSSSFNSSSSSSSNSSNSSNSNSSGRSINSNHVINQSLNTNDSWTPDCAANLDRLFDNNDRHTNLDCLFNNDDIYTRIENRGMIKPIESYFKKNTELCEQTLQYIEIISSYDINIINLCYKILLLRREIQKDSVIPIISGVYDEQILIFQMYEYNADVQKTIRKLKKLPENIKDMLSFLLGKNDYTQCKIFKKIDIITTEKLKKSVNESKTYCEITKYYINHIFTEDNTKFSDICFKMLSIANTFINENLKNIIILILTGKIQIDEFYNDSDLKIKKVINILYSLPNEIKDGLLFLLNKNSDVQELIFKKINKKRNGISDDDIQKNVNEYVQMLPLSDFVIAFIKIDSKINGDFPRTDRILSLVNIEVEESEVKETETKEPETKHQSSVSLPPQHERSINKYYDLPLPEFNYYSDTFPFVPEYFDRDDKWTNFTVPLFNPSAPNKCFMVNASMMNNKIVLCDTNGKIFEGNNTTSYNNLSEENIEGFKMMFKMMIDLNFNMSIGEYSKTSLGIPYFVIGAINSNIEFTVRNIPYCLIYVYIENIDSKWKLGFSIIEFPYSD